MLVMPRSTTLIKKIKGQFTNPSLEHEAKPIWGSNAKPRTASRCPLNVRTLLFFFQSLMVLSADAKQGVQNNFGHDQIAHFFHTPNFHWW